MSNKPKLNAQDRTILVRVKVERAKKHLLNLETELTAFGRNYIGLATTEVDPNTRQESYRFGKHRIFLFDTLSAAGDVVHNLRSALDHLAHQLVWVGTDAEPGNKVSFPIAEDATAYERNKIAQVRGMCPKVIRVIDGLKPYKGGNGELWRISQLDNIDKHRTLFTYAHDCFLYADWLDKITGSPYNLKAGNPNFVGVEDSDVEQEMEFKIDKAGTEPPTTSGNALLPTLHQLVDYVENLLPTFFPYLE